MTLLTLLGVALFVVLGRWQWHRGAAAEALQQAFAQGSSARRSLPEAGTAALPRYSGVQVRGRYDSQHQFLLDNMSHAGQPGYDVLTPLKMSDGRNVIVNRGWIPLTESRRQLPDVGVSGAAGGEASGRLDNLPRPGIALGHAPPAKDAPWPKLTSFPTMADLSDALGRPLEPRELLLDASAPDGYTRDWQPPGMSPAQHFSYAFQWWLFAAVALVLYGALNRRRLRLPAGEAVIQAGRAAGPRPGGDRA
jgi:surfeit locus 1 family protein